MLWVVPNVMAWPAESRPTGHLSTIAYKLKRYLIILAAQAIGLKIRLSPHLMRDDDWAGRA
jgi:hypothetical protein